jgi:hypothetical protein
LAQIHDAVRVPRTLVVLDGEFQASVHLRFSPNGLRCPSFVCLNTS